LEQWSPWLGRSWDPRAEFQQLWDQMSQLFAQTTEAEAEGEVWRPLAETEETEDAYVVRAELPGFKRDDIHVDLSGNELSVSGEMKEEQKGNALRRRYGRFMYRTTLPADADADRIAGELSDGVLTVRVPKSEQGKARRIEIKG
jgi:HSP20 family protein